MIDIIIKYCRTKQKKKYCTCFHSRHLGLVLNFKARIYWKIWLPGYQKIHMAHGYYAYCLVLKYSWHHCQNCLLSPFKKKIYNQLTWSVSSGYPNIHTHHNALDNSFFHQYKSMKITEIYIHLIYQLCKWKYSFTQHN